MRVRMREESASPVRQSGVPVWPQEGCSHERRKMAPLVQDLGVCI
jgi:hypothetical protein